MTLLAPTMFVSQARLETAISSLVPRMPARW